MLGGANDGGYAQDNRRLGDSVNAAKANIDQRIKSLKRRAADAKAGMADWNSKNDAAYRNQIATTVGRMTADAAEKNQFMAENAGAVAGAKDRIENCTRAPTDPARTAALMRQVDAKELSLHQVFRPIASRPMRQCCRGLQRQREYMTRHLPHWRGQFAENARRCPARRG